MIATPRYEGLSGIIEWIVSIFMASAALFCGVDLTLVMFFVSYGNLLPPFP